MPISFACVPGSPCDGIIPEFPNPAEFFVIFELSTMGVSEKDSYCHYNTRFMFRIYGMAVSSQINLKVFAIVLSICFVIAIGIVYYVRWRVLKLEKLLEQALAMQGLSPEMAQFGVNLEMMMGGDQAGEPIWYEYDKPVYDGFYHQEFDPNEPRRLVRIIVGNEDPDEDKADLEPDVPLVVTDADAQSATAPTVPGEENVFYEEIEAESKIPSAVQESVVAGLPTFGEVTESSSQQGAVDRTVTNGTNQSSNDSEKDLNGLAVNIGERAAISSNLFDKQLHTGPFDRAAKSGNQIDEQSMMAKGEFTQPTPLPRREDGSTESSEEQFRRRVQSVTQDIDKSSFPSIPEHRRASLTSPIPPGRRLTHRPSIASSHNKESDDSVRALKSSTPAMSHAASVSSEQTGSFSQQSDPNQSSTPEETAEKPADVLARIAALSQMTGAPANKQLRDVQNQEEKTERSDSVASLSGETWRQATYGAGAPAAPPAGSSGAPAAFTRRRQSFSLSRGAGPMPILAAQQILKSDTADENANAAFEVGSRRLSYGLSGQAPILNSQVQTLVEEGRRAMGVNPNQPINDQDMSPEERLAMYMKKRRQSVQMISDRVMAGNMDQQNAIAAANRLKAELDRMMGIKTSPTASPAASPARPGASTSSTAAPAAQKSPAKAPKMSLSPGTAAKPRKPKVASTLSASSLASDSEGVESDPTSMSPSAASSMSNIGKSQESL